MVRYSHRATAEYFSDDDHVVRLGVERVSIAAIATPTATGSITGERLVLMLNSDHVNRLEYADGESSRHRQRPRKA